jgi:nucleoside 2-deoxyribosyltransferase
MRLLLFRRMYMPKKIYIAGKITGDPDYQVKFMFARNQLMKQGDIVLSPSVLPEGMAPADYMRICFAMIDTADAVAFLPDFGDSKGTSVEMAYCEYTGKEILTPWGVR